MEGKGKIERTARGGLKEFAEMLLKYPCNYLLFLKPIKGKVFALSPKPRPSWGLCRGGGLVSVFTVCLSLRELLLAAGRET